MRTGWHNFVNKVKDLIANRPEVVVAILGAIGMIFKSCTKWVTTRKLSNLHNDMYDRRAGHYVSVKRKLTGRELEELDRRYKSGESYSKILSDMRLLK